MSKQNNLKDYLTDLYEGISTKRPNASRNPQNFRAEIESIESGKAKLQEKTLTANGVYPPDSGYDGFSKVTVDVAAPAPKLQEKSTDKNGVVLPDEGFDGLSKVTVNVPSKTLKKFDGTVVVE